MPQSFDAYCYTPVLKGFWKQHELWDGTYTLLDLVEIHKAMKFQRINENLVYDKQMQELEAKQSSLRY